MPQYQIAHSPRLSGDVKVGTSKNAVLPILAAALLTNEEIKLAESGVIVQEDARGLRLRGKARHPMEARTLSCPGFPTDMQAPLMTVATQTHSLSVFLETIFENRYQHVAELKRLGAHIRVEGQLALIQGGRPLNGAAVTATDLRAAAALMLAGLTAQGQTILSDPTGHLIRGYEGLEEKLRTLGADAIRVS